MYSTSIGRFSKTSPDSAAEIDKVLPKNDVPVYNTPNILKRLKISCKRLQNVRNIWKTHKIILQDLQDLTKMQKKFNQIF